MNTPPFLVGATLVFWGWQAGLAWVGVLLGLGLEAARWVRPRWEFSQADLNRTWNLCTLLFVGSIVLAFAAGDTLTTAAELVRDNSPGNRLAAVNRGARSALLLFQWMPLSFLPIVLVQAYGQADRLSLATFSWWVRQHQAGGGQAATLAAASVNVAYPYFGVCLLAASTVSGSSPWFFGGLAVLVSWGLWPHRPRGFQAGVWAGCLAAAVGLGFAAQSALTRLQDVLQRLDSAILSQFQPGRGFSEKETQTQIGTLGRLKLSGRIALRVETDGGPRPGLLRESSYNLFKSTKWICTRREFSTIVGENDETTWRLRPSGARPAQVQITARLPGGVGLLALPQGSSKLTRLPAFLLQTNQLGTVRMEAGPSFVRFQAAYDHAGALDAPPLELDREVPPEEEPWLDQVIAELGLREVPAEAAVTRLGRFFAENFSYATILEIPESGLSNRTALGAFLLQHRRGHCEYFATAAALVLRRAGIPARYATGYSVQERAGPGVYVVRDRHAHAWVLAWVDGHWREVDPTPGDWVARENQRASWWEPLADAWSRLRHEGSKWWWGVGDWRKRLVWLVLPLLALAVGQMLFRRTWRRVRPGPGPGPAPAAAPGTDSELFAIERHLARLGLERAAGETFPRWLRRVDRAVPGRDQLEQLLPLHYRFRFDPRGLNAAERAELRRSAQAWISQARATPAARPDAP